VKNGNYTLVATASSGLEVQFRFRSGDEAFANLSGTTLTPLHSGQIEVTAFIADDHNYVDAEESRTIIILSSNTTVKNVIVSNATFTAPDFYVVDCGINNVVITIITEEIGASVSYKGVQGNTFDINTDKANVYTIDYTIESTDGTTANYSFKVEKQFAFDEIVGTKFNNVLFVNNNPETNGGYHFTAYEWFENGQKIGEGQYYSVGKNRTDVLNEMSQYSVTLTTDDGTVLHSCEGKISLQSVALHVYPNPVRQDEPITIEYIAPENKRTGDAVIQIYDASGTLFGVRQLSSGNLQQISLPTVGVYMIKVGNEIVKIIVHN
jgi:hypothetical protein